MGKCQRQILAALPWEAQSLILGAKSISQDEKRLKDLLTRRDTCEVSWLIGQAALKLAFAEWFNKNQCGT